MRQASDESGHAVGVLVDLQGPKIRLGKFATGPIELLAGDRFTITTDDVPGDQGPRLHDVLRACPATRRPATGS